MIEFNQARADAPAAYLRGFGGDTSNMAIAAARLGAATGYATRIGGDPFGRMLLRSLACRRDRHRGVAIDDDRADRRLLRHPRCAGPRVLVPAGGLGGGADDAGNAAARRAAAPRRFCTVGDQPGDLGDRMRRGLRGDRRRARDRGAGRLRSQPALKLWPLPRARAVIVATMAQCDWFLPSLDEARMLAGVDAPDAIIDWCHAQGAPVVALKCGADGARVSADGRRTRFAAHSVASVDATGAGDCFDGAFVARVVAGDDPFAAARFANAAAALADDRLGAVAPLPAPARTCARLLAAQARRRSARDRVRSFDPDIFAGKVALVVGVFSGTARDRRCAGRLRRGDVGDRHHRDQVDAASRSQGFAADAVALDVRTTRRSDGWSATCRGSTCWSTAPGSSAATRDSTRRCSPTCSRSSTGTMRCCAAANESWRRAAARSSTSPRCSRSRCPAPAYSASRTASCS